MVLKLIKYFLIDASHYIWQNYQIIVISHTVLSSDHFHALTTFKAFTMYSK